MIKDFKYILKRVIIGVLIALALAFLKGALILNTQAMTVNSQNLGSQTWSVNATTSYWYVNKSFNNIWYNWGPGYVYFNIGISKQSIDSVAPLVSPKSIVLSTSTSDFACSFDSSSVNNSTYINQHYSVTCPVNFSNNTGLTLLTLNLMPNNNTPIDTYEIYFDGLMTFVNDSPSLNVNVDNSASNSNRDQNFGNLIIDNRANTQSINNNNNTNTQSIINNQNSNAQSIINNQNSNTEQQIESQKVCSFIDSSDTSISGFLQSDGTIYNSGTFKITDFISIDNSSTLTVVETYTDYSTPHLCFYNVNKSLISCVGISTLSQNQQVSIPNNTSFVKFSINKFQNRPQFKICKNGNQAINDSQQQINNTLNDDNVSSASSSASSFFGDFQSNSHGLSGIISSPLRLIQSLSSSTCTSLQLPLPFVNQNATIPCMSTVYERYPTFLALWQLITTGLIAYNIIIRLFGKVHDLQDPTNDRIEVLSL